mmetsp:Transcript_137893/g.440319  ORF Transcript_137893/g.440319 Transcript_137893/m.440319 type:complete len:111 (-) Transcript_137893:589-921(-)
MKTLAGALLGAQLMKLSTFLGAWLLEFAAVENIWPALVGSSLAVESPSGGRATTSAAFSAVAPAPAGAQRRPPEKPSNLGKPWVAVPGALGVVPKMGFDAAAGSLAAAFS